MKIQLILAFMTLCGGGAVAQSPYMSVQGVQEKDGGVVVSQPKSTLAVDVTVEKDVTICGPYARYAQKFLGVRAPLTDKTTYSIKGASVALVADNDYLVAGDVAKPTQVVVPYNSRTEFYQLQPDRTDMVILSLEDASREAATAIFSLRKHRIDLITGEAGENVFGAGLESALKEIDAMEQRYLELFLGKRVVTTTTERYIVSPRSDKTQYILCRFSEKDGVLPETDLTGELVFLQVKPSDTIISAVTEASVKETSTADIRLANESVCSVMSNGREVSKAVLPLFEFGRTVKVALPRKR